MARESKDDRWHRWMTQQGQQREKELEIVRFKIKEQLWAALEADFGTRIACDHSLANHLTAKVDECFDSIEHIRKLTHRKGGE